jgi:hypothetical protein
MPEHNTKAASLQLQNPSLRITWRRARHLPGCGVPDPPGEILLHRQLLEFIFRSRTDWLCDSGMWTTYYWRQSRLYLYGLVKNTIRDPLRRCVGLPCLRHRTSSVASPNTCCLRVPTSTTLVPDSLQTAPACVCLILHQCLTVCLDH